MRLRSKSRTRKSRPPSPAFPYYFQEILVPLVSHTASVRIVFCQKESKQESSPLLSILVKPLGRLRSATAFLVLFKFPRSPRRSLISAISISWLPVPFSSAPHLPLHLHSPQPPSSYQASSAMSPAAPVCHFVSSVSIRRGLAASPRSDGHRYPYAPECLARSLRPGIGADPHQA